MFVEIHHTAPKKRIAAAMVFHGVRPSLVAARIEVADRTLVARASGRMTTASAAEDISRTAENKTPGARERIG
jgi:hypothetical protein